MTNDSSKENIFDEVVNRSVLLNEFNLYFQSDKEIFYMAVNDTVIRFTPQEFFAFSFAINKMWGSVCNTKFDEMMNKFLNTGGNTSLFNPLKKNGKKKLNFRKLPKDSESIFKEVNKILKPINDNRKKEEK